MKNTPVNQIVQVITEIIKAVLDILWDKKEPFNEMIVLTWSGE